MDLHDFDKIACMAHEYLASRSTLLHPEPIGISEKSRVYWLIRPLVIGRKNWLFSDTVAGAQASANLYSLIETAKANGVEPYRYLCKLFQALPAAKSVDDYEALLPWNITPAP